MPTKSLPSTGSLKRAVEIAAQIDALEAELHRLLQSGGDGASTSTSTATLKAAGGSPVKRGRGGRKGRVVSEEARRKMAEAQKRRWAKARGQSSGGSAAATPAKPSSSGASSRKRGGKRTFSPEARAKMAEAARRRWAARKG